MSLFSGRPAPDPIALPMTPLAVGGTVLWLIAATVMWFAQDSLAAHGRSWWIDCALYGIGMGIVGTVVMVFHDRGVKLGKPRPK